MTQGRQLLADWRDRSKLKQKDLARMLDVTDAYLSQVLAGRRRPKLELLIKIEHTTGVPVESWAELADGNSDEPVIESVK